MTTLVPRPTGLVFNESLTILPISPQQFITTPIALGIDLAVSPSTVTPPGCPDQKPGGLDTPGVLVCYDENVSNRFFAYLPVFIRLIGSFQYRILTREDNTSLS